jgi:hypothetical protein
VTAASCAIDRQVVLIGALHKSLLRQFMPGWQIPCKRIDMATNLPVSRDPARDPEQSLVRAFASLASA